MTTNQLPTAQNAQLMADLRAKFMQSTNASTGVKRNYISLRGSRFHLKKGDETLTHQGFHLDVHILGTAPTDHYVFHEHTWAEQQAGKTGGKFMSRPVLPTDDWKWTPTKEWAQRTLKHRLVVCLANDPTCTPFILDLSYMSIKGKANTDRYGMNYSGVKAKFIEHMLKNESFLPHHATVRVMFNSNESVPVLEFYLNDTNAVGVVQLPSASAEAVEKMDAWLATGELDQWLDVTYSSEDNANSGEDTLQALPAPTEPAVVVAPAPVEPTPVQQNLFANF